MSDADTREEIVAVSRTATEAMLEAGYRSGNWGPGASLPEDRLDDANPELCWNAMIDNAVLAQYIPPTKRAEPVLDNDTVDILRALIHATDIIREKGTLMPFHANILLNWATDQAEIVIRNHAKWIKEHSHAQAAEHRGEHETDDGGGDAERGPA